MIDSRTGGNGHGEGINLDGRYTDGQIRSPMYVGNLAHVHVLLEQF
jgi:hypothetical protein